MRAIDDIMDELIWSFAVQNDQSLTFELKRKRSRSITGLFDDGFDNDNKYNYPTFEQLIAGLVFGKDINWSVGNYLENYKSMHLMGAMRSKNDLELKPAIHKTSSKKSSSNEGKNAGKSGNDNENDEEDDDTTIGNPAHFVPSSVSQHIVWHNNNNKTLQ